MAEYNEQNDAFEKKSLVFIDVESTVDGGLVCDYGALKSTGDAFHSGSRDDFLAFVGSSAFLCGHNIIFHDLKCVFHNALEYADAVDRAVDTLYWSPLLFPSRPYHALVKDDKLQVDELSNPLNDCQKCRDLLFDEVRVFKNLDPTRQKIFYTLLNERPEFSAFFRLVDYAEPAWDDFELVDAIKREFRGRVCANASFFELLSERRVELAYALALVSSLDDASITPPWLTRTFPKIENVMRELRFTRCDPPCDYCRDALSAKGALKRFFGFDEFRSYGGEPLQERATRAALDGASLLAIFPTGGGKSLAFQLPALVAGAAERALTVVISPLQSLMKDQVDNLAKLGIVNAATINGLLDPIERANAVERVADGSVNLLYIAPESLRSRTIEKLLTSRVVARFVIDEAHCFSAWGQDFRVDYLYIGEFIQRLRELKNLDDPIPVSCFTATAQRKVISDICDYFRKTLNLNLELFATTSERENLTYRVIFRETDGEKYATLRTLLIETTAPSIVYASRTRRVREIAQRLVSDGVPAAPFHGKMDAEEKIANQEAFARNEIQTIVATSAFGMGVDKKDVKLVVHYDISSSLEDYVQEAGRAGRDPNAHADCYVLFNDDDLNKHFILLNQTKLSISEIQQVWRAIKELTRRRAKIFCSPLEIARRAGWDDSVSEIETRVKTALAALERGGYIRRGRNVPCVYASGIRARTMQEASERIDRSTFISDELRGCAKRIVASLISSRAVYREGVDLAEARVDYLADVLGITKDRVVEVVNLMRQDGLLEDTQDMSAYIFENSFKRSSKATLSRFEKLERFLIQYFSEDAFEFNFKELNDEARASGVKTSNIKSIRTILFYLTIKRLIRCEYVGVDRARVALCVDRARLEGRFARRLDVSEFVIDRLYELASERTGEDGERPVVFSLVGLFQEYSRSRIWAAGDAPSLRDVEDALLYLSKIEALRLEGGFLVLYNALEITRLVQDYRIQYKREDYRFLDEFYRGRIRQIHIVGEYANLMARDLDSAVEYVRDYFQLDYKKFIDKYFKGDRAQEIERNMTPRMYEKLFGSLSASQKAIISDAKSKRIVVAAGPGSGKTRTLVHKLASLYTLEDVKHEQMLMLTFSRSAATEFKKRLMGLIGGAAKFIDIKTFHSYCFDLLGRVGTLNDADKVVADAVRAIRAGEVETNKVTKRVLVVDEAQDMDENEYELLRALMELNDGMRVIAVGDDDQNIFEFRGSSSKYMRMLMEEENAKKYELTTNYRSRANLVAFANAFVATIADRLKSTPSTANGDEKGVVRITRHVSRHMESAIVEELEKTRGFGSCCVLTRTNEEALRVCNLLSRRGLRAKMIQSLQDGSAYNLVEARYFLKKLKESSSSSNSNSIIGDEEWENARSALNAQYAESECLEVFNALLDDFAAVSRSKYRSDFEIFLKESRYEDFYREDVETIFVSTYHKAKGREFDAVYLMVDDVGALAEDAKRALYVAITRAKSGLYIHTDADYFRPFVGDDVEYIEDNREYPKANEITLQLGHRDVYLDFFRDNRSLIFKLRSGAALTIKENALAATVDGRECEIIRYSKAFRERLRELTRNGYRPVEARVRFIVAWHGKNDPDEIPLVLPDLLLRR